MYKRFYGLTRNPFELSPDPSFYYPTPQHNEAFAMLNYCVLRRKGFVVVSGEVGTGKTLLLRCLMDTLNQNQIASAVVYNPRLSVSEFLAYVLTDLHVPFAEKTKGEMLSQLNNYLLFRSRRGTTAVLVVDEAHLLSWEMMEEIRLLTNLETSQHKLLQIVLVGQPELDLKIDSDELRQLKQRIAMRCRLKPMGLKDVRGYIGRRLELAGAKSHDMLMFSNEAIEAIYKFSNGIPRLTNTLCENSLISGYGRQTRLISAEIVQEAAADLRLAPAPDTFVITSGTLEQQERAVKVLSE